MHTGGIQFALEDKEEYVLRDIRIVGSRTSLLDSQARKFARALLEAADYIAEMEASDGGTGSP